MGKSTTFDPANSETGLPAQLNFSRVNNLLGDHPILTGRDGSERIDRVLTFAGQSLKGPERLGRAPQVCPVGRRPAASRRPGPQWIGRGTCPGAGLHAGSGQSRRARRGRDALGSGQRPRGRPMGMNVPGTDNRQFALNIMHWLSGVKFPASTPR